jgi:protein gp37
MNKTKIDWADSSWNPVTGCLRGCEYCYARGIARRFAGYWSEELQRHLGADGGMHVLDKPLYRHTTGKNRDKPVHSVQAAYPYGFCPTFHRYRLGEPARKRKPQTVFVGSMTDLFGSWVPDEWIKAVLEACNAAPQHRYLFLTKNPDRYYQLGDGDDAIIPEDGTSGWFGASACTEEEAWEAYENTNCIWMSLEPIHGDFSEDFFWHTAMVGGGVFDELPRWSWIVVGAESGNRTGKVIPERKWIENIVGYCRAADIPVFMKESLRGIMGGDFVQEFPWEVRA